MNKVIAGLVLTVSMLMSNEMYMGIDLGMAGNTHTYSGSSLNLTPYEVDNDSTEVKLKLGYGEKGDMKVQGYFNIISYDKGVYDTDNNPLYEVGAELIKEFSLGDGFYPFVKLGAGFGLMSVTGYGDKQASEISINGGAGIGYELLENITVLGGIDYVYREWGNITDANLNHRNIQDEAMKFYIGANYSF